MDHPRLDLISFSFGQVGDTSLPLEQPEMLDDDFLKALHHVLLEVIVAFRGLGRPDLSYWLDSRRGGRNDLSEL